jgi:type I restriction enzyme S subunit
MTLRLSPDTIVEQSDSPLLTIAPWWDRCRLGDIAEVTNGAAFKSTHFNTEADGLPLIRIRDVGQPQASTYYRGDFEPRHLVKPGDLLVGMDGDFRIARWIGQRSLLNQRVCRIRVRDHDHYSDQFLEYVVQPYLDEIHKVTSAVTVKHLSSRTLIDLPIPLPPRAEQERLVAAIEEHFSRLDAAETTLRQTLARLETLRSSILADAFHARGDLPVGWKKKSMAEVARVQLGRQRSPQHHSGKQMRPYLRAANVTWSGVRLDDVKTMNFDDAEFEQYRLTPGDLLLNEASGSANEVGKPAIWNGQIEDCCFQNTLLRLRPHDVALRYLYWYCHLSARSGEFGEAGRGVNIRHLGKQGLSRFPIPVAPRDIQDGIAARLDLQMQSVEELQEAVRVALDRVATLRRAVLAAAFSGRLVPQDPDDEPASVLLERIAASRPRTAPRRRRRA